MRYRLPDDCAGVSHAGIALDRAADGTIEAADSAAASLAPHGIRPVKDVEPIARTTTTRSRAEDRRLLR